MKQDARKKTLLLIAVIIGGFAAVFSLSGFVEKNRPALPENYADEDLTLQGARLKGFVLGAEGLIADWYWMRSLQYLGNKIVQNNDARIAIDNLTVLNPRLLYPYLDNATALDTRFMSVYEFGATVLPAIDKEQAIKLLKKGIEENPNEWKLYQHLGFIYWRLGEYEKASEIYAQGAKIPGAPNFMQMMVAKTKSEGGSRETARAIYQQMFDEAQDEQSKENARLRLLQLDSMVLEDAIRAVLRNFQAKNGRCVNDWRELFPLIRTVRLPGGESLSVETDSLAPVDPTGVPYLLDRESGKCDVRINYAESVIPTL